jgi:signal transduction histidine kinase
MKGRLQRPLKTRTSQELRSWLVPVLLSLVVLMAICCVLWFLREAMRNERTAMREKLAEAYRGHLQLVQSRILERWNQKLGRLDGAESAQARFARCVTEGLGQSVICFDEAGGVAYPERLGAAGESKGALTLQERVRALAKSGEPKALARFVLENFPSKDTAADEQGRLVIANAELLALQELGDKRDPDFQKIAARLVNRVEDYQTATMPSAQRRFIMHSLRQLDPAIQFPLLEAEDLAARFLDANARIVRAPGLHATELPDVWSVVSPAGRALALFTKAGLRKKLGEIVQDPSLPAGVSLGVEAPGDEPMNDPAWATVPAGPGLPGWRIALSLDDRTLFDAATAQRVQLLVSVACVVIVAISGLSILIARSFGRQTKLAGLKNDLVANVSHELKTPLTAMRALVDTLLDTERLDEKTTREYLQLIATENARLSRLIENFLTFSRIERNRLTFDLVPVRPEQIVEAAVAAFGDRAQAPGCSLEASVEENLPPLRGSFDGLTTALLNLLDNAWKYSGDRKQIRVRASRLEGRVSFEVEDNGFGLSAKECRRVFGRYYRSDQRLDRVAGGCGLGLSIVQSIAEAHHGTVHVTSSPGTGSSFFIEIPAMLEATP